ncbi:hypothetical protein ASE67_01395 [Sphingomonas sp. Leaf23]|uniref:hypothetical protein n=1 Tax=Sphingomonas sp. Leaf23 TaxID=1735689 RepID=UPI0006F1E63F|nr:hypothetical protein [Sphingomonas sp. Leaf23]KQM88441.1 hypothetical protein ASE67_01395 [Sphingomonas sp. Leaf23]
MKRAKAQFKQIDVTRAVRGALAGGVPVSRTEITPDGKIVIFHDQPSHRPGNPFDRWKQNHAG